jgi:hypothetical protein
MPYAKGYVHKSLALRFLDKVELTNNCWHWTGAKNEFGYGRIQRGGRGQGQLKAHHVGWFLVHGEWPAQLNHTCDGKCVNPAHMYEGTQSENMFDRWQAYRSSK